MVWKRYSSHLTILTFALSVGLGVNAPAQVLAQSNSSLKSGLHNNAFQPPRTSNPRPEYTEGGATRGGSDDTDDSSPDERAADKVAPLERSPEKLSSGDERAANKVVPLERSLEKPSSDEQ